MDIRFCIGVAAYIEKWRGIVMANPQMVQDGQYVCGLQNGFQARRMIAPRTALKPSGWHQRNYRTESSARC